jgi:hypothetical protein
MLSPALLRVITASLFLLGAPLLAAHAAPPEKLGKVSSYTAALAPVPGQADSVYLANSAEGRRDCGAIQILQNRRVTTLFSFDGYNGKSPKALARVRRAVYGITTEGGQHGNGTLFRIRSRGVQTLVQFDETTGAPRDLQVEGQTLYGTCENGVFIVRGRRLTFLPFYSVDSTVMLHGRVYVTRLYSSGLYLLEPGGETLLRDDWDGSLLRGNHEIFGVTSYGGRYDYGSVESYNSATGVRRTITNFQSYNGGHPRYATVLKGRTVALSNNDGIWLASPRPKQIMKTGGSLEAVRVLNSDGGTLYGMAGYFSPTAFRLRP